MTIVPRTKTSSVILKILKILIQKKVTAGEYYIETCQGEDASIANPRIREIPIFLKILIQKKVTACEYYIETCRGEDASIASLQDIQ